MPVCCQDQTVDNKVLEGRLVKEGSGHNQQSVEPSGGGSVKGLAQAYSVCVCPAACLSVLNLHAV